jgi:hypothetical protein
MSRRTLSYPDAGNAAVGIRSISQGGTGQSSAQAVAADLDVIRVQDKGSNNGIASLDINGKIPKQQFDVNDVALTAIYGPKIVSVNSTTFYQITNFDSFTDYELSCEKGQVFLEDDRIHYVAPSILGAAGFMINGRKFDVQVTA